MLGGSFVGIFLLQWWGARRCGLRWVAGPTFRHPAVKRYFALAIPLMLGQSLVVLDEQLGRTFGSFTADGGVSWLTFGRQTMLVPVGVIAQAAGVAAYPFLARLVAEGKLREMAEAVSRALRYIVVLSLAAAAALMALSVPAIRLLYERGPFDAADTRPPPAPWSSSPWACRCGECSRSWRAASTPARTCGPPSSSAPWPPPPPFPSTGGCTRPWEWTASPWPPASPSPSTPPPWPSSGTGAPGGTYARPVAVTSLRNLPLAAAAGLAAWAAADWVMGRFPIQGEISSLAALAVGGIIVVAVTLAPPWVRRDLK